MVLSMLYRGCGQLDFPLGSASVIAPVLFTSGRGFFVGSRTHGVLHPLAPSRQIIFHAIPFTFFESLLYIVLARGNHMTLTDALLITIMLQLSAIFIVLLDIRAKR